MGLFAALFDKSKPEERQYPPEWLARYLGGEPSASGVSVSDETALKYTAFYSAVDAISRSLGQVPLSLYQRVSDTERLKASGHPLYRILHTRPNPEQTAFIWRQTMQSWCLRWGNSYSEVERNGAGRPVALHHMRSDRVQVRRNKQGRLVYEKYNDLGRIEATLDAGDVIHIRTMGDGMIGYSPVRLFRETIGLSLAAEKFGSAFFGNGARPSGALEHPGKLSDPAHAHLKESFREQYQGAGNVGKVVLLEEGMKWTQQSIPNDDAQFLETRQFQISDIARIFHIPPHKLADLLRATFSNIEQQSIEYVVDCLDPWLKSWEQELDFKLLLPAEQKALYSEFNVDGLLRGDIKARHDAYHQAILDGWMSRNEVRAKENMNQAEGLDEYLVPQNMGAASQLGEEPDAGVAAAGDEADEDSVRTAHLEALTRLTSRIVTKETNALRTAAKNPGSCRAKAARFLEAHAAHVEHIVAPAVKAAAMSIGVELPPNYVRDFARAHVDTLRNLTLTDEYERTAPAAMAKELLAGLEKHSE